MNQRSSGTCCGGGEREHDGLHGEGGGGWVVDEDAEIGRVKGRCCLGGVGKCGGACRHGGHRQATDAGAMDALGVGANRWRAKGGG